MLPQGPKECKHSPRCIKSDEDWPGVPGPSLLLSCKASSQSGGHERTCSICGREIDRKASAVLTAKQMGTEPVFEDSQSRIAPVQADDVYCSGASATHN